MGYKPLDFNDVPRFKKAANKKYMTTISKSLLAKRNQKGVYQWQDENGVVQYEMINVPLNLPFAKGGFGQFDVAYKNLSVSATGKTCSVELDKPSYEVMWMNDKNERQMEKMTPEDILKYHQQALDEHFNSKKKVLKDLNARVLPEVSEKLTPEVEDISVPEPYTKVNGRETPSAIVLDEYGSESFIDADDSLFDGL